MRSTVYFGPATVEEVRWEATLPAKLDRVLEKLKLASVVKDQVVAVKMHLGGHVGYTTIHPLFVRRVVDAVRKAGGRPFVCDDPHAAYTASRRGYTELTIGCPVFPVAGVLDRYAHVKSTRSRVLKRVYVAGNIADAGAMINLSHAKGHPTCGYGGAIKNLAMGAVTGRSRGEIHGTMGALPFWDPDLCDHCLVCVQNCRKNAIRFDKQDRLRIDFDACNFCMRCAGICPEKAIKVSLEHVRRFNTAMALATREVLKTFEPGKVLHINLATDITPFCDCFGMSTPDIVPDVGVLGSADIVAVEQATLDLIGQQPYIEGSLPATVTLEKPTAARQHLFQRIHGKDPYGEVNAAAKLGMGSQEYRLVRV